MLQMCINDEILLRSLDKSIQFRIPFNILQFKIPCKITDCLVQNITKRLVSNTSLIACRKTQQNYSLTGLNLTGPHLLCRMILKGFRILVKYIIGLLLIITSRHKSAYGIVGPDMPPVLSGHMTTLRCGCCAKMFEGPY